MIEKDQLLYRKEDLKDVQMAKQVGFGDSGVLPQEPKH